jgi:hypothetical protein
VILHLYQAKVGQMVNCWFTGNTGYSELTSGEGISGQRVKHPVMVAGQSRYGTLILSNTHHYAWRDVRHDEPHFNGYDYTLASQFRYCYSANNEVKCELIIDHPGQICAICGIPMPHIEANGTIICKPCETLVSLE